VPNPDKIPLTSVSRELAALTNAQAPSYRKIYLAVLDGTIPAEQVNGRWHVQRGNLRKIAETFGMAPKTPRVRARKVEQPVTEAA
jgi:hypothetical protein